MFYQDLTVLVIGIVLLIIYPKLLPYVILFIVVYFSSKLNECFTDPISITSEYGYLIDDIAYGNPQSWSHQSNKYMDGNSSGVQDAVISQGTPFPLPYEERSTIPVKNSMFFFGNYECKPECCINGSGPYSCSNGCVCWGPPKAPIIPTMQALRTTPTS